MTDLDPSHAAAPVPATAARPSGGLLDLGALGRLPSLMPARSDDAVAIVNGLAGDSLAARESALATPMTLRAGEMVLPVDDGRAPLAAALAAAGVRPTGRVCVLVHGLMSTESIWRFPGDGATTYGTVLAGRHDDLTVLSLRYNTGLRIADNGRELASMLGRLVRSWPVTIREIDLIGHSMGGLVVRSACHYGPAARPRGRRLPIGRPWTTRLCRVVLIGVPNTGAGLAALVDSVGAALASLPVPVVRAIGQGLERRSAGIKDLRLGLITDADESDDADRRRARLRRALRAVVPSARRVRELVVVGTVAGELDGVVSRVLGDAIVGADSAAGRSPDGHLFPHATTVVFPRVTHNALAHHADVAAAIAEWW